MNENIVSILFVMIPKTPNQQSNMMGLSSLNVIFILPIDHVFWGSKAAKLVMSSKRLYNS
jgi:hypothetical protein